MFLVAALFLSIALSARGCEVITLGETLTFNLRNTNADQNCFTTPGTAGTRYRLTIRNNVYGHYAIRVSSSGPVSMGYGWGSPADGIYYCVNGSHTLYFNNYVADAVITVSAEVKQRDCNSDFISFNGVAPIDVPSIGATKEVYWSGHKYFLKAASFQIEVKTDNELVTMSDSTDIEITGDPGSATYSTMEISWTIGGKSRRFYAYMYADSAEDGDWRVDEVRVYDKNMHWVYFNDLTDLKGKKGNCFKRDTLVLKNNNGDRVTFEDVTIAAFLPWSDDADFLDCIDGIVLTTTSSKDSTAVKDSFVEDFGLHPLQISVLSNREKAANERRSLNEASTTTLRIVGKDGAQASCIKKRLDTMNGVNVTSSSRNLPTAKTVGGKCVATKTKTGTKTTETETKTTNSATGLETIYHSFVASIMLVFCIVYVS